MKKLFVAAAALLLLSPLTASAVPVATGSMTVVGSAPEQNVNFGSGSGTYYADYDASYGVMALKPGYTALTFKSGEVFCVENADMYTAGQPTTYDFYTSDALNSWAPGTQEIVTWIANWAVEGSGETRKATAQVAIWKQMIPAATFGASTYSAAAQTLITTTYANATNKNAYVNDWLLAVSPTGGALGEVKNYQNFLVKATATPVPEPGVMLLFGAGLGGVALLSRRRKN